MGSSLTNALISLTQSGNRDQFRRAFAAVTLNDVFNFLTYFIFLPIEMATGKKKQSRGLGYGHILRVCICVFVLTQNFAFVAASDAAEDAKQDAELLKIIFVLFLKNQDAKIRIFCCVFRVKHKTLCLNEDKKLDGYAEHMAIPLGLFLAYIYFTAFYLV